MPRGKPDYGIQDLPVSLTDVGNNALLTAALGFSPIDYRGQAIFIETFKDGFTGWETGQASVGSVPTLDNTNSHRLASPVGVKMLTNGSGGLSKMYKVFQLVNPTRIAIEIGYYVDGSGANLELYNEYNIPNVGFIAFGLRYSVKTGLFSYFNSGVWDTIPNAPTLAAGIGAGWLQMKIVYDVVNLQYLRMVVGGSETGMIGLTSTLSAIVAPYVFKSYIQAVAPDATYKTPIYIGYVIISRDE